MTVAATDIRLDYPQFHDPHVFSDRIIQKYINLAVARLSAQRWGSQLDYGTELFVAHYLTLKTRNDRVLAAGGIPGLDIKGPLTSRSVDGVSNSWDSHAVSLTDGGFWNQTIYGIEFLQLARLFGMGGVQL